MLFTVIFSYYLPFSEYIWLQHQSLQYFSPLSILIDILQRSITYLQLLPCLKAKLIPFVKYHQYERTTYLCHRRPGPSPGQRLLRCSRCLLHTTLTDTSHCTAMIKWPWKIPERPVLIHHEHPVFMPYNQDPARRCPFPTNIVGHPRLWNS